MCWNRTGTAAPASTTRTSSRPPAGHWARPLHAFWWAASPSVRRKLPCRDSKHFWRSEFERYSLHVTDFLEEKRREIDARLKELKPLVEEYNRLEAASQALAGVGSAPAPAPRTRRTATRKPSG